MLTVDKKSRMFCNCPSDSHFTELKMFAAETLSEDEDDTEVSPGPGEGLSVGVNPPMAVPGSDFTPTPGGPFSALTPSMWPQDILSRLNNPVSQI